MRSAPRALACHVRVFRFRAPASPAQRILGGGFGRGAKPPSDWNVQRVRLACGPRAPPCSWTLLIALARAFLRGRGRQRSGWAVLGSVPACLLDRLPHPARRDRERGDADAEVAKGITYGVGDRAAQSRVAALTEAAEPERVRRGRHLLVEADDGWHVVGPGQRVVHQGAGQELALVVVVEALEQRVADAEGDTADELTVVR